MAMNPKTRCVAAGYLAGLIVLLAAWLRLGAFQEALVGADQSSILAGALEISALRDFPVVGIKSSIGVMQTAVTPYLAALPLLLVRRVIAAKAFFSLLDVLAVALLFHAVRRAYNPTAAFISALLYAANPWVVEYIRWIWYQTLISTFSVAAFSLLLLTMIAPAHQRRWTRADTALAGALAALALMSMVHLAAAPWAVVCMMLCFVLALRRGYWRGFAAGVVLCLIIAAPYLLYLLKTSFVDVGLLAQSSGAESGLNWSTYRLTWELLGGRQVLGTPHSPLWRESVWAPDWLYDVIPVALLLSALATVVSVVTGRQRYRARWLMTLDWALLAPAIYLATRVHLQHFYLLFVFPAPFVLIGAAIAWLAQSSRHIWRWIGRVALLCAVLVAGWWSYLWTVRIGYEQQGELRAVTRAWVMDRTAETIQAYIAADPERQVIILTSFEGGLSPFDWIRNYTHSDRLRVVAPDAGFIIPSGPACYMLGPDVTVDALAPVAGLVSPEPAMTAPSRPPWTFHCFTARGSDAAPRARWQNGLELLDARISGEFRPGQMVSLSYRWHYGESTIPATTYHIFNHLVAQSAIVAQVDGSGVPSWYWREGDVLITRFELRLPDDLPAGDYALRVGFYTWPGVERIFLVDGADGYTVEEWTYMCPGCVR